jgi:hypothetical protein
MLKHPLDFSTRKALEVQLGVTPGKEIAEVVFQLAARIEQLERTKVDKTMIVPMNNAPANAQRPINYDRNG